jgi:hypothetical protein
MNPFHILQLYFPKIHFNIILLSTLMSSESCLPFRLSNRNFKNMRWMLFRQTLDKLKSFLLILTRKVYFDSDEEQVLTNKAPCWHLWSHNTEICYPAPRYWGSPHIKKLQPLDNFPRLAGEGISSKWPDMEPVNCAGISDRCTDLRPDDMDNVTSSPPWCDVMEVMKFLSLCRLKLRRAHRKIKVLQLIFTVTYRYIFC